MAASTLTRTIAVVFPGWAGAVGATDPELPHRAFEPVVRTLAEVAAVVHVAAPGTALIDARGPCRYFGGEERVLRRLHDGLTGLPLGGNELRSAGSRMGIAVADGRLAAVVMAHRVAHAPSRPGAIGTVPAGESPRFLARIPVEVLALHGEVSDQTVEILGHLGLRTLGAVARLDERALIDRFGAEGERIHLLVHGRDPEPLVPESVSADLDRRLACDDWPQADTASVPRVVAAAHDLCVGLVDSLAGVGRQCVRLRVTVTFDRPLSGVPVSDRIWHEQRGFTAGGMLDRLRWQLSATGGEHPGAGRAHGDDPEQAPPSVSSVVLSPVGVQPFVAEHQQLWGGRHDHDARAARAVTMALAADSTVRITVPEWSGGRDVVSMYGEIDVGVVDLRDADGCRRRVSTGRGSARYWSGTLPRPLPATVHRQPRPVSVRDGDGAALVVTGRHLLSGVPVTVEVDGRRHHIADWAGPWPVEERWWDPLLRRRLVRLQVRIDQTVYLLQLERSQWSVVARYD